MATDSKARLTLLAFLVMVILAGGNAVAVKFTVLELPPFWGAAMRFAAACAVFFVAMAVRKVSWPRGRALVGDLAFGLFTYAAPFGLFYWGVQNASAATGGVILAGVPLLTILLAFVHRIEKLTARGIVGSLLAPCARGTATTRSPSCGTSPNAASTSSCGRPWSARLPSSTR